MSKPVSTSAALPVARVVLYILMFVNWLMVPVILALLFVIPSREWIMSALKLSPSLEADRVVMALRAIAGLGLVTVPLNYLILQRLLAMVETVRAGDPFIALNAKRLRAIAWTLVALQCVGLVIDAIVEGLWKLGHPVKIDAGFSLTGWLAVLLTFILARVFAEGARMRDDLEGTV